MSLAPERVVQIARLARIRLTDEETGRMAQELSHILSWIERLSSLDTETVPPMSGVVLPGATAPLRADAVTDGAIPDRVLANAPERVEGFFTVPKVVE